MQTDILEENAQHDAGNDIITLLTVHFNEGNEMCRAWGIVGPMCLAARAIRAHHVRRAQHFDDEGHEYAPHGPAAPFGDQLVVWRAGAVLPELRQWCLTLMIRDVGFARINDRRGNFILAVPIDKCAEFARDVRAIAQNGRDPMQPWDNADNDASRACDAAMRAFIDARPYFGVIRVEHFGGFYANTADSRREMRAIAYVFTH